MSNHRSPESVKQKLNFWFWFSRGINSEPGYMFLLDYWIGLHLLISGALVWMIDAPLQEVGKSILMPFLGILFGLTFAWSSNAQALLMNETIKELLKLTPRGYVGNVYSYQLAILVVLAATVAWGITGLGLFEIFNKGGVLENLVIYRLISIPLFFLSSLALRTCWQVIINTSWLLISLDIFQDAKEEARLKKKNNESQETENPS